MLCVAFNQNHPLQLATGGQDEQAFLLQLSGDETPSLSSCHLTGHQDSVCSVAFSYTGEYLATADMNGVIKVWSSSNGQLIKTLQGPEDPEWIRWHSKSNILMASGNDFTIWSWSLPKGFALPVGRVNRWRCVVAVRTYGPGDVRRYQSFGPVAAHRVARQHSKDLEAEVARVDLHVQGRSVRFEALPSHALVTIFMKEESSAWTFIPK